MRLTRISDRPDHIGVMTDAGLVDATTAAQTLGVANLRWDAFTDWTELREQVEGVIDQLGEPDTTLVATVPIPPSAKLICIGLNYRQHAVESGLDIPTTPVVFSKLSNAPCLSGEPVALPRVGREYDYEVELGVVIGAPVRDEMAPERALDAVFGYVTANDLSARDLQGLSSQWLLGKSLDRFLPLTPWITTVDEVEDPDNLDLKTWVNGELRQDSNTADMIFSTPEIISFLSRYMTLSPGDLILTGTPPGVILGMPEPRPWLVPGDTVAVEVEGLGKIVTPLVGAEGEQPM